MGDLINTITDFIGGVWDSPAVQLGIRALAIYVVILWLAAAYWAFRDMQLRTSNPILPYFAASLIVIFTPIFFIFAVIAYRIVRPQEKIGEVYERTLAEEALLAEVEAVKSCPTCARRVDDEWIICPTCRTRLNRVCPNCSRLVGLDWSLCAWCGRDFERTAQAYEAIPAPRPAQRPEPAAAPQPSLSRPSTPALEPAYAAPPIADRTTATASFEQGAARSLDRAPQPPTATRPAASAPVRASRPSQRASATPQPSQPLSSTDPLPERSATPDP